jgi:acetyl-CoA synthetase
MPAPPSPTQTATSAERLDQLAETTTFPPPAVVAYVTVVGEAETGPALTSELRDHVGIRIGRFARPKRIIWAPDLPQTRSGKIMRRLLRDIADHRELGDVSTLADPSVVEALQQSATEGSKR